jgi:hypothetical protein
MRRVGLRAGLGPSRSVKAAKRRRAHFAFVALPRRGYGARLGGRGVTAELASTR